MMALFPLQFIQIDILDLIWLYTQVIQCLPLCAVVEHNHQLRNAPAESLSQYVVTATPQLRPSFFLKKSLTRENIFYMSYSCLNNVNSCLTCVNERGCK